MIDDCVALDLFQPLVVGLPGSSKAVHFSLSVIALRGDRIEVVLSVPRADGGP